MSEGKCNIFKNEDIKDLFYETNTSILIVRNCDIYNNGVLN